MKYLFLILFNIIALTSLAQVNVSINWVQRMPSPDNDTIYYQPDKKLVWQNFKGDAGKPSIALAVTSSGLGYNALVKYHGAQTNITMNVYCYFNKQNSWVRKGRESDYALTHEQHHFDVTYIATNLFIQKLRAANFTRSNYNSVIDRIYKESCDELERMQNAYDGQTKNGQLKDRQYEWNAKIDEQLNGLQINNRFSSL